ncbi:MAG: tRNA (N(6)-L-threonylcarbamoyladenosine(37)-C(2))-methylthiotransferase MtaB [Dehalococcoidales bacterium]|nr:tRNA (N(6)-L-threonylcarbamoyladenosine(37)-C(2))-methylthiotransferase MtaB [Dehalococcoidales bacterium]
MVENKRVALATLGCKLNQAETELLARQFVEAGYELVSEVDEADVYILNTCTVTNIADVKSRHLLRLAHRRNPKALLVATGCYAQSSPQALAQIEGVSLVVGNDKKARLPWLLEESGYLGCLPSVEIGTDNHHPAFRTRAFIKVQEGCNNFCSYCIVPLVRGREKSLPVARVMAEVKHRISNGYKEVVLTGSNIGSYDYEGINLAGLLERILTETDVIRLRLSSLQPRELSPELIGLWRDSRLCPHFHLSLQSGSNGVLARMRRRYDTKDYQKAVSLIRTLVPGAAITTDIIVGFPGETEEEFEESYSVCQQLQFSRIHVFTFSPRRGTPAARMLKQVGAKVKKQRSQKMLALAEESADNFRRRFLDKIMTVLWESRSGDRVWSGLTGNYLKIFTKSNEDLTNKLLPVKLIKVWKDGVWGEVNFPDSVAGKPHKEYNAVKW